MTEKQKRFAHEYAREPNASLAVLRAGYNANERSAASIGSRLLRNVEIRAYLDQILTPEEGEAVADAQEVCAFLTRVMRDRAAPLAGRLAAANLLAKRWGLTRPQPEAPMEAPIIVDFDDLDDLT